MILLKNPMNASTRLSMNGKSPIISHAPLCLCSGRQAFVPSSSSGRALRLSKDERKVFQQRTSIDSLAVQARVVQLDLFQSIVQSDFVQKNFLEALSG